MAHLKAIVAHNYLVGKGLSGQKGLHKNPYCNIIHKVRYTISSLRAGSLSLPHCSIWEYRKQKALSIRKIIVAGNTAASLVFYIIEV